MENNPLVTVNILSYNRKDELRNTLTKVYEQDYKYIEVIVVDNASNDGSREMVEKEFPNVNLIKLEKNIGIVGWNIGFKAAKGEYVLVLDDDSYPKVNNLIRYSVLEFDKDKLLGVIAFKIWNQRRQVFENEKFSEDRCPHFVGCGAMIKKQVFFEVGGFNELLFLYEHERDFTLRLYDKGYHINYQPNLNIIHISSFLNRTDKRRKYYFTRNYLIILFLNFYFRKSIFRIVRIALGRLISGIRQGGFLSILKSIISFLLLLPQLIRIRKPVKLAVQKKFIFGAFAGGFHFKENDWYN